MVLRAGVEPATYKFIFALANVGLSHPLLRAVVVAEFLEELLLNKQLRRFNPL